MTEVVRVLDDRRWRLSCWWLDFVALGLFVVVTVSLFYEMYTWGYTAYAVANGVGSSYARDALAARMMGEALIGAFSFAWIAYRCITAGHRALDVRG